MKCASLRAVHENHLHHPIIIISSLLLLTHRKRIEKQLTDLAEKENQKRLEVLALQQKMAPAAEEQATA